MKRIFRISALIALCIALTLTVVSCGASSPESNSGDCGSGLTWSYDSETQALSISGNGQMTDYESSSDVPWNSLRAFVKTINIALGVEKIGDHAFYGFSALEAVTIPDSVIEVGELSFAYCTKITGISLPDTLTTVGDGAFEGCSALTAAFIPADVTSMGEKVFAYCYSVTDAAVLANIEIPESTFLNCRSLDKLLLNKKIGEDMISENAFSGCSIGFEDAKFTESKTASASVTVKYLDGDGNELADAKTEADLAYGESYSIVSPAVEGYTADKLTVSGYVYGSDEEITVTYTKDEVVVEPETPEEEEDKDITPSTIIAIVVFGVVIVGIAVGAILLMRADKKNSAQSRTVRKNDSKSKKK